MYHPWLERAYHRLRQESLDRALDSLCDDIDNALCQEKYYGVNLFLQQIPQEMSEFLVPILIFTFPARKKLNNRSEFYQRVRNLFLLNYSVEYVDQLLYGLE